MINISGKQLIPAAIHYVTRLASSVNQVKSACPSADVSTQEDLLLRESADAPETVVDKDLWPLPSYGDLLFEVSEP